MAESGTSSKIEVLCGVLSVLLPFALYIWTATPSLSWLDSGEFLAVGYVLGAAHPPGHPLYVNLLKLVMLLPIGSLAFRGSLASAIPAAFACYLSFRINLHLARRLDLRAPRWMAPFFALLGALLLAVTPALWTQATRPEVYALQLAVALAGIYALIRFGLQERGRRSGRLVALAGLAFGLSLANHHFLSLLLLPGVIVLFTEDALAKWQRTLKLLFLGACPAILTGLLVYAHLPLRARNTTGAVSLGVASDISTFFWVISARAFQRSITEPMGTTYVDRLIDTSVLLAQQISPIAIIIALGGFYFMIRQKWGIGLFILFAFLATWLTRSWMEVDPLNPDLLGYLLIPVCLATVSLARLGPLLANVINAKISIRVGAATVVAIGLITVTAYVCTTSWRHCDRSSSRGAEIVAEELLYRLPPRTVLITELFGIGFNTWSAQTIEGMRPDVAHFHFPFIGFPSYAQQVHAVYEDLQGVLRAALSRGVLDDGEISALAQRRPVFVEPMLDTPRRFQPFLLPRGLTWEAAAEPLGSTDLNLASLDHTSTWDEIIARLGDHRRERQTQRVLLWRLYVDALLLAQRGEREGSAAIVSRGLIVAPQTPELEYLGMALGEGEGRLDVTPFLPRNMVEEEEPEEQGPQRTPVLDF